MIRLIILFGILALSSACSSAKQKVPAECEFNEDCAAGYKCVDELAKVGNKKKICRDIYHPYLLPPQKVTK